MGKKRIIQKSGDAVEKEPAQNAREVRSAPAKQITEGAAHILATYNNTLITITDEKGNTIAWSSAGALGFSGAKKATPFAAARAAEVIAGKVQKTGPFNVRVFVSGVGSGRDSAIRALANHGLNIISVKDVTPLPHNGPRPKKVRRV